MVTDGTKLIFNLHILGIELVYSAHSLQSRMTKHSKDTQIVSRGLELKSVIAKSECLNHDIMALSVQMSLTWGDTFDTFLYFQIL